MTPRKSRELDVMFCSPVELMLDSDLGLPSSMSVGTVSALVVDIMRVKKYRKSGSGGATVCDMTLVVRLRFLLPG